MKAVERVVWGAAIVIVMAIAVGLHLDGGHRCYTFVADVATATPTPCYGRCNGVLVEDVPGLDNALYVWCDEGLLLQIRAIAGVYHVGANIPHVVLVDKRYSVGAIREQIDALGARGE